MKYFVLLLLTITSLAYSAQFKDLYLESLVQWSQDLQKNAGIYTDFEFCKECYEEARLALITTNKRTDILEILKRETQENKEKVIKSLWFFIQNGEKYIALAFNRNVTNFLTCNFMNKKKKFYQYDVSVCYDLREFVNQIKDL